MPAALPVADTTRVPPVLSPPEIRRLLLVKLSSLGDIVHTLPLLSALRTGLGESAFLGWAVQTKFADLLTGNPALSQLYPLQSKKFGDLWKLRQQFQKDGSFDVALDAQGLLISGLVTASSGAKHRIGYNGNREGNKLFLTHPVVPSRQRTHIVDKLLTFCDTLGIQRPVPQPQTYLVKAEATRASELLQNTGNTPCIGMIVGASTADKAWSTERWSETAKLLAGKGYQIVLLGGPGETAVADAIIATTGNAVYKNLVGKTPLRVLASVMAQCSTVIGGDSGPTHLAVAVGTPVVGLYGVTDPVRTGPNWGAAPAIVLDFAETDAPPQLRRPRHGTLPDALSRIPAQAVAEAVLQLQTL